MLPLSRETTRVDDLKQSLPLCRLIFGQPRQEELLEFLKRHSSEGTTAASTPTFGKIADAEKVRVQGELARQELSAEQKAELSERLKVLTTTDMALIVSPSQNEIAQMKALGFDIEPHRKRMNDSQPPLDEKFKDTTDPLRLAFVCAMWLTGFDAPSCSTVYLDKPMRNHMLMQTIARANRVFPGKHSGVIVDYANVFASLEKALAIYGAGKGGKNRVPSCSELSRYGLARAEHAARLVRRPTLTAPARDDMGEARVGTKERLSVADQSRHNPVSANTQTVLELIQSHRPLSAVCHFE
jgi:hypothetical protein